MLTTFSNILLRLGVKLAQVAFVEGDMSYK